MIFEQTTLKGAVIINLKRIADERGFFSRTFCAREFQAADLASVFVQSNMSFSRQKGTLRGMHYQIAPFQEAKLVRCTAGAIYDVAVDLRRDSSSFRRWFGIELSAANATMLYVP
ncbi:MAG: dTDP-4-dehydrorhamnose 3,5-epimerase family protein, partial [Candidatus Binataceae bacterium]